MPLTSTYLKQMKLRVMNSQEQVSGAAGAGQRGAQSGFLPVPKGRGECLVLGTSVFGGCFWKWPVCAGGSGSAQAQPVLVHGSWEGSAPLSFWLGESKQGYFSVVSVEGSGDGADAVIAYNGLLGL